MDCKVGEYLGGGGQGEVYKAELAGQFVAVKWYFSHSATSEQREGLELLIKRPAPNNKFLWPMALATAAGIKDFGYVMPLREKKFIGITDLMLGRVNPRFRELVTAGMQLADSYFQLHAQGLCYCDISFGNAFFDPDNGEVLICDNDNIMVNKGKPRIGGTMRFMAPEIVRNEAQPSIETDRFSLAVLLFYMLMINHPLEGAKEASIKAFDQAAMRRLYGDDPLFIFDPGNPSNRPVPGYQDAAQTYWDIYPTFLKNRFIEAFTKGLRDPQNGRVVETLWRRDMLRLRDSIIYCPTPGCGAENFYDGDALRANGGKMNACWKCHNTLPLGFRIRIETHSENKQLVMLNHDSRLYPHHIDPSRAWDFSKPVAEVNRHPTDPKRWGLKNLSDRRWNCSVGNGPMADIEPGRSALLANGTKVNFNGVDAEVRYG